MRRNPALRRWASRQLRRWPALHQRLVMYELARFYRSLGILLQGGIPILTAMCMARGLLGSTSAQGLEQASRRVGKVCRCPMRWSWASWSHRCLCACCGPVSSQETWGNARALR